MESVPKLTIFSLFPFVKVNPFQRKTNGLELATCWKIAISHGATITADCPMRGKCIFIYNQEIWLAKPSNPFWPGAILETDF